MRETRVWSLGREDPLEKGMATHSSTLAWRVPWTEEPDWLHSMGLREFDSNERLNTNMHASGVLSEVIWHPLFLCLGISIPPLELVYQSKIANGMSWWASVLVLSLSPLGVTLESWQLFFFFSLISASPSGKSDPTTHTRSPGWPSLCLSPGGRASLKPWLVFSMGPLHCVRARLHRSCKFLSCLRKPLPAGRRGVPYLRN